MRELMQIAWHRFNVISGVVSDTSARVVSTLFYFTVLVPFGIGSVFFSDPMRTKEDAAWLDREPVPTDIDSAKQQG
jgi:hypothetical protein